MTDALANLRTLAPHRPLTRGEALRVAELQSARLLAVARVVAPPVPESLITDLPRVRVQRLSPIPVSGSAHWAKGHWMIVLNSAEPATRQRFSLAHELKHVLDGPITELLYPGAKGQSAHECAEQVADFFAACLLMPRMWVKRLFCQGVQDVGTLAKRFGVSRAAMEYRLVSIGLVEPKGRCQAARVILGGALS